MHLIDKHMYPKNFFFNITRDGIDGRRSLLLEGGHHRRRSSTVASGSKDPSRRASILEPKSKESGQETEAAQSSKAPDVTEESEEEDEPDADMEELAGAMSSLQFVPSSVRFGRGGKRGGFAKR